MGFEIWIILALAITTTGFYLSSKDKKAQIERLNHYYENEKQKYDNQITCLQNSIVNENQKHFYEIEELQKSLIDIKQKLNNDIIAKEHQYNESKQKYNELHLQYSKLLRCYMLARQSSEVDTIIEIEDAIARDFSLTSNDMYLSINYIASAMADYYTSGIKAAEKTLYQQGQVFRSTKIGELRNETQAIIIKIKSVQYIYEFLLSKILAQYPEIDYKAILSKYNLENKINPIIPLEEDNETINKLNDTITNLNSKNSKLNELKYQNKKLLKQIEQDKQQIDEYLRYKDIRWTLLHDSIEEYQKNYSSNLTAIPYMSRIIADILTIDIDKLAWSLSWGNNQERKKKVASLSVLKKEKQEEIEKLKWAEYQLAYLLEIYPTLQDVIDTEFKELSLSYEEITNYDPVIKYMDKEEWEKLSESERNQLALDRYIESRKKSNWQIGRDYELYCGYIYEKQGYNVDYFGSYHGLEDLGRDLIIKQGAETQIVQCKYWSQNKEIHENHIMQLYGSVIEYNIENKTTATGVLITNTRLSEKAKEFAKVLGISFQEKMPMGNFPRIKCNIGIGELGEKTKIYHLPFDQQYDSTKIDSKEEFMAMTVAEAEAAGFRRAYKWLGSNS